MLAVIRLNGKQYTVKPGDSIVVEKISGEVGETVKITDVLLLNDEGKIRVGTPNVKNSVVTATVEKQERGEKIEVRRFRAKSRYRRKRGFRPHITTLKITDIS